MFSQEPAVLNRDELLAIIDDIREGIRTGDSLEGFINWTLPLEEDAEPGTFMVEARYRVGNTMGQGGYQIIGEFKND